MTRPLKSGIDRQQYGNTTWPGFTTFDYLFSDMHGPRQPAWDFYKESLMDFVARNTLILQSGVPKMDLAFYQYLTTYPNINVNYMPSDLEAAGMLGLSLYCCCFLKIC